VVALSAPLAAFKAVGPEGTWEAFNKALGRQVVCTQTTCAPHGREGGGAFEQARSHWFETHSIGRGFSHLPCNRGTGLWRVAG
jgi:hypothetical protein